jgi:hypothetical protein
MMQKTPRLFPIKLFATIKTAKRIAVKKVDLIRRLNKNSSKL